MLLQFPGQQLLQKLLKPEPKSCGLNATKISPRPDKVVVPLEAMLPVSTAAIKVTSHEIALYNKEKGATTASDMVTLKQNAEQRRHRCKTVLLQKLPTSSFMAMVRP